MHFETETEISPDKSDQVIGPGNRTRTAKCY